MAADRPRHIALSSRYIAEAIELGRKFMQIHLDHLGDGPEVELEIRQMAEFGPDGRCAS